MKNRYEIRDRNLVIFLDRRDGSVIETVTNVWMLPMLMRYDVKWCAMRDRTTKIEDKYYVCTQYNGTTILMHRVLMEAEVGEIVDHEDTNRLNNRMRNLRKVSASLNSLNRAGAEMRSKTGVRNVYWDKKANKYIAKVKHKGKAFYMKYFDNLDDAREAAEKAREQLTIQLLEAR